MKVIGVLLAKQINSGGYRVEEVYAFMGLSLEGLAWVCLVYVNFFAQGARALNFRIGCLNL